MFLHLVRHGRPAIDNTTPARAWRLHVDARDDVQRLRDSGALPPRAIWYSSPEPKALETAVLLHPSELEVVGDLCEAERGPVWLGGDEFVTSVRRSFESEDVPGAATWEPLAATRRRVVVAAGSVTTQARVTKPGHDLVLVGHGTAWTLLVADLTGSAPDLDSWEQMTMPDHCSLDLEAGKVVSRWGQWREQTGAP